jgi:hypothetical protein
MGEMDAKVREESTADCLYGIRITTENRTPGYINFNGNIQ